MGFKRMENNCKRKDQARAEEDRGNRNSFNYLVNYFRQTWCTTVRTTVLYTEKRRRRQQGCAKIKRGRVGLRHIAPNMVKLPCGLLIAQANEGGGGGERRHDMPTLDGDQWPFFLPFKSSHVHLKAKTKKGLVDARVGRDDIEWC